MTFTDKWRARWPEWSQAIAFVPAAQRELVAAWFALLQELTDAAWREGDATPGLAKLAWWQEELQGWAKGARRHPLGAVLQPRDAPWPALAHALAGLREQRTDPVEAAPVPADAFAHAVVDCEAALFGSGDGRGASAFVAASLAAERALAHPASAAAPRQDAWPAMRVATRPRRIHAALQRARLQRPHAPSSPWGTLFAAWRAARGG